MHSSCRSPTFIDDSMLIRIHRTETNREVAAILNDSRIKPLRKGFNRPINVSLCWRGRQKALHMSSAHTQSSPEISIAVLVERIEIVANRANEQHRVLVIM
jgi:hypothetical protein